MTTKADQQLIDLASRIVEAADARDINLRLIGAIGIRLHCPKFTWLHKALGRTLGDVDLVGYSKDKSRIDRLMNDLGLVKRPTSFAAIYSSREIYYSADGRTVVDLFLDRLQMNHTIEFKGILELDRPTVPLAELLMQKLQIVRITEKDLKDIIVLIREHDVGISDDEEVNVGRIASMLSHDWGFWYTVIENIKKMTKLLPRLDVVSEEDKQIVLDRLSRMMDMINNHPKSTSWKLRAMLGTTVKWYKDVERFETNA
jgi:hypothetical protein